MNNIRLVVITLITAFTLTAFCLTNWKKPSNNGLCSQTTLEIKAPTFYFDLSALRHHTLTKERLHHAQTISELMPDYSIQEDLKNNITTLRDVVIQIEGDSKQRTENGHGDLLSNEQLATLRSTDYSSNFYLEGYITSTASAKADNKGRYFKYDMTVVPEQIASYKSGKKAFIEFLSSKSLSSINQLREGHLKNGNIRFTVTKEGSISNIDLTSSCGYPSMDEKMMQLLKKLPNDWNVAANSKGEKLSQDLILSFGQKSC